jgi:hypothetical protein
MRHELAHGGLSVIVADDAAGDSGRAGRHIGLVEHGHVPAVTPAGRAQVPCQVPRRRKAVNPRTDHQVLEALPHAQRV